MKDFFTEREQLKEEKRLWEETKMAFDAPVAAEPGGNWSDANYVKQQKEEVNKEKTKVRRILSIFQISSTHYLCDLLGQRGQALR